MDFDIRQLQIFVAVAEQCGFSRGAKVLGMAQASVSERIAGLEKEIGARLFDRLGRKVRLTRAGELLLERAREIIGARDSAACEMKILLEDKAGTALLGGSTSPGEYRLPSIIADLRRIAPEITVHLRISDSERIIEEVESGAIEIGVVGKRTRDEHLEFSRLWSDRIVLVVPADHAWARSRKPVTPPQLMEKSWVLREPGSATRHHAQEALARITSGAARRPLRVAAQLGSLEAVKNGVKAGLGIALLSEMTVRAEITAGELAEVEVEGFSATRSFHLVRDARRTQTPAAELIWKHLLATASSSPDASG